MRITASERAKWFRSLKVILRLLTPRPPEIQQM